MNSTAIQDVIAERRRQVEAEGWTPEHDDQHARGEMARAAACYAWASALPETAKSVLEWGDAVVFKRLWPWDRCWWKPKDRRRDLIRAAALIVAEIERLDRAAEKEKQP